MSQSASNFLLPFCIGAALAGGGVYYAMQATSVADDVSGGSSAAPDGAASDLVAENNRLRQQIQNLEQAAERKRIQAEEAAAKAPEQDRPDQERDAAAAGSTPPLEDPKLAKALNQVDWALIGNNLHEMQPMLAKLAEALAKGESPDLAAVGEIQKLNGDLMKLAQILVENEVPGAGINGAFTHPSVASNQIAATLAAAGLNLNEEQQQSMKKIMQYYAAKDQSIRLSEDSREFSVEGLLEEADYKDAFYKEAKALLSEEQGLGLGFSEAVSGRARMDLFDSSLMLSQFAQPIRCKDPGHLATRMFQTINGRAKLSPEAQKQLNGVLADWSGQLPRDFFMKPADTLSNQGMMKSSDIRAALRRQVDLFRMIDQKVDMSPADRAALKKQMAIFVPLPQG